MDSGLAVTNPTGDNDHCFKGWSRTNNATTPDYPVVYGSNKVSIPYDAFTFDADDTLYEVNLYPVWGAAIAITYRDPLHGDSTEHVDPEAFAAKNTTENGYTMTWNTAEDGSGTSFARGEKITSLSSDTELFAQWTKGLRYKISFYSYRKIDGTDRWNPIYTSTSNYDTSCVLSAAATVAPRYTAAAESRSIDGYTFKYYVDENDPSTEITALKLADFTTLETGSGNVYDGNKVFVRNIRAVYAPQEYTINVHIHRTDAAELSGVTDSTIETDYYELSHLADAESGRTGKGVTFLRPTYQGMTFLGWGLYDGDGNCLETATGGTTRFALEKFRNNGNTYTITDRWRMNYRIIGKPNNADCTAADKSYEHYVDDYDDVTNITANIGAFKVQYFYDFAGYSFAEKSASADAKDPAKSGTEYVSIPKTSFTYDSDVGRYVTTVYGQWYKNFNIRFVAVLADGNDRLVDQPFQYWLSDIDTDSSYTFTAPTDTPVPKKGSYDYSNCYTFKGGWSREQKQLGVIQTQAPITSVPLSAFEKSSSVFQVKLYAIYEPVTVSFVYDPYYMVDTVVSDENITKFDDVTLTGFPAAMDTNTYTVTRNFDQVVIDGGYQLAGLNAAGFEFKKWTYETGVQTYTDKAPDFLITNGDVKNACDYNNATIPVKAQWHRYNRYTFLYDVNDAVGAANGLNLSPPTSAPSAPPKKQTLPRLTGTATTAGRKSSTKPSWTATAIPKTRRLISSCTTVCSPPPVMSSPAGR